MRALLLLSACLIVGSCGGGGSPSGPSGPTAPPNAPSLDSELAFCWSETNRYRATVGRAALARSAALDGYASDAARSDGTSKNPHGYANATNGGNFTALAENLIPWWSLSRYGSVRAVIQQGLALMWAEGPGGGHHRSMAGGYTLSGCGVFVSGDEVTVVQAFR